MAKKSTRANKAKKKGFEVLSGEGKRFSFQNLKQAVVFYVLLLMALVIIAQLGYHWLGDQYLAWRLQITEAELGYIQRDTDVRGFITRREEVITAPNDGMILAMAPSGKRLAAGKELVTFGVLTPDEMDNLRGSDQQGPDEDLRDQLFNYWQVFFRAEDEADETAEEIDQFTGEIELREEIIEGEAEQEDLPAMESFAEILVLHTETAGFVSHYVDGWEHYDGPLYLEAAEPAGHNISEGDLVEAGEPLIKIVDNWDWYYSIKTPLHPGRTIAELTSVEFVFDFAPGEMVTARREHYDIEEDEQEVRITYIIDRQLPGFDQVRYAEASLLYLRDHGIIIPVDALYENEEGKLGVYINQGGRVLFQPVTVVRQQDDQVMVEGLSQYSLVITRPNLVEEGQRLN